MMASFADMAFNLLTCLAIAGKLCHFWCLASGRLLAAFTLMVLVYAAFAVIEGWLYVDYPGRWGLLGFIALDLCGIVAGVVGYLASEEKKRKKLSEMTDED